MTGDPKLGARHGNSPGSLDGFVDRFFRAVAAGDAAAAAELCTEDVVHELVMTPASSLVKGRDALRAFFGQLSADLQITGRQSLRRWHGADFVIDDSLLQAKVTGTIAGLPGRDRQVGYRELCLLEFRDQLISRVTIWLDMAAIEKQLAPGAPG